MDINGFIKTTLVDYPGHIASTIFLAGCNFRCPFCHNKDLVLNSSTLPKFSTEEIIDKLKIRKKYIDGVCITGGEPTLEPDLLSFISAIKDLDLKVKLDTNGYKPHVIKRALAKNLLDYIAMDIKNSPKKYPLTCGLEKMDFFLIKESISIIKNSNIPYEFRTTIIQEFHTREDLLEIGGLLNGSSSYYLQNFESNKNQLQIGFTSYSKKELETFKTDLQPFFDHVHLRGTK